MRYIPPFEVIKQLFEISTSKGQLRVTTSYENLIRMVKLILAGVQVDEDWYLKQYTDVAQAISDGMVGSARQHFIDNGYFEGRLPFAIDVDDKFYQKEYPDVADSIGKNSKSSAQDHFLRNGYREGRLPFQG